MRGRRVRVPAGLGALPALIALGLGLFLLGTALGNLEQGRDLQGKEQLEQSPSAGQRWGATPPRGSIPPT